MYEALKNLLSIFGYDCDDEIAITAVNECNKALAKAEEEVK
jgi:hypothetical protein